jgi:hypothetical protein
MLRIASIGIAALLGAGSLMAHDNDRDRGHDRDGKFRVSATLTGGEEVPASFSTPGRGSFSAVVDTKAMTITWRLHYEPLESAVQQAHVHFGQKHTAGGVSFFLCSNLGNGPVGTQACPPGPADLTGIVTPLEVIGPAAQGIAAGEFAEIAEAIRDGTAYANVHSTTRPGGEIRGQLR